MAGVDIRTAAREDAGAIKAMLDALAASIGSPGAIAATVADIERFGFGDRPCFEALIAARGAEDVGLLLGFPEYSSWQGRPGSYVQDLYVTTEARGSGIARALLGEAARRAEAAGGTYLRLSVDAANRAALDFYRAAGFRAADQERIMVLEGPAFAAIRDQRSSREFQ